MKFTSKWAKAIYVVRPSRRQLDQLGIVTIAPGLRAVFEEHAFDSEAAAAAAGWSEEERKRVEEHLLKHKDYGNGLILMPGQEVPEDMLPNVPETVAPLCTHVDYDPGTGKVEQCERTQVPGGEGKCEVHKERQSQVIRGMLSS